jgi:hypothetical protein
VEVLLRKEPAQDKVHCVGECPNCQSILKEKICNLSSWSKVGLSQFGYGGIVACPVCEFDAVNMYPVSGSRGTELLSKASQSTELLHHSV